MPEMKRRDFLKSGTMAVAVAVAAAGVAAAMPIVPAVVSVVDTEGPVVPGFAGNFTGPTQADMLRFNMSIPPTPSTHFEMSSEN